MYLYTSRALFAICIMATLFACGTDEPDPVDPEPLTPLFSMEVDGTEWIADNTNFINGPGLIYLEASKTNGETFKLLVDEQGIGEVNMSGNQNIGTFQYNLSDPTFFGTQFPSQFPDVSISKIDTDLKTMSGTFTFELGESNFSGNRLSITGGNFANIPFKYGNEITENNTFQFSRDGQDFNVNSVFAVTNSENIYIAAGNDDEHFIFVFRDAVDTGTLALNSFSPSFGRIHASGDKVFRTSNTAEMAITNHDPINKLIEGSFNLTMINEDSPSEVIDISGGSFSVSYD